MDWADSPEQEDFRKDVRTFIQNRLPEPYRNGGGGDGETGGWQADRKSEDPARRDVAISWASALAEKGWIAPHWPKQYGGAGLSTMEQFIFNQEMAEAQAPPVGGMGVGLLGPTLIVHGNDEQKAEHLPKILSGEIAWAQGYSEPGAGSDLASLQTRAVRDGDEYVINGQKIWTSGAHTADWLFALVRTDPEAPKHRGISFLMMDKNSPGLSVRPLINMANRHHFNEVFFEDVRIPRRNLVGEENRGWYVGMTLLDFERSGIGGTASQRKTLEQMTGLLKDAPEWKRERYRLGLAELVIENNVAKYLGYRIGDMQAHGKVPNYEASVIKIFQSELGQRIYRFGVNMLGLSGQLMPEQKGAPLGGDLPEQYLTSVPSTIYSGSNEIQRNIIATRGLGLPRA
jgi:alkylation response protein AidB-like acyl-CoA dehydrogenase